MKKLTKKEWQVLRVMASSLLKNSCDTGDGYFTVGDTLVSEEVELLKKLAE